MLRVGRFSWPWLSGGRRLGRRDSKAPALSTRLGAQTCFTMIAVWCSHAPVNDPIPYSPLKDAEGLILWWHAQGEDEKHQPGATERGLWLLTAG